MELTENIFLKIESKSYQLTSFYKIIEILIQLYGHPSNLPYRHPSNLPYGHPSNLPHGHPFNLPVPSTTYTKTNKCKQTVSVETSYLPPYTHTWPKFVSLERILILFTDCFQSYIRDTLGTISHLQSVIFNRSSWISHLQSVILNQWSPISDLQSIIFNQWSPISHLQSVIFHHPVPIILILHRLYLLHILSILRQFLSIWRFKVYDWKYLKDEYCDSEMLQFINSKF